MGKAGAEKMTPDEMKFWKEVAELVCQYVLFAWVVGAVVLSVGIGSIGKK